MAKPKMVASKWSGLTAEQLMELERDICRCGVRTRIAQSSLKPASAIGRLNGLVHKYIQGKYGSAQPQYQEISLFLEKVWKNLNGTKVSRFFLEGETKTINSDDVWVEVGYWSLRFLLQGSTDQQISPVRGVEVEPNLDVRREVSRRIVDYFFRGYDPARKEARSTIPFFEPSRLRFGEPCSTTELAGEIAWIARDAAVARSKGHDGARIVFVSGGEEFPLGRRDDRDAVARELAAAAVSGDATAVFLYADPISEAARSVEWFLQRYPGAREGVTQSPLRRRDNEDESVPEWHEFINPALRFLYFNGTSHHSTRLLILRLTQFDIPYSGPFAHEGTAPEIELFEKWLAAIDRGLSPQSDDATL